MLRVVGVSCAVLAVGLFLAVGSTANAQNQVKKSQMVKGTIKTIETDKDVLIVNQKVKNEVVDRELSIGREVEFEVTIKGETKKANGREGLRLLEGHEGSSVQVKCDKDVNVISVKVKAK